MFQREQLYDSTHGQEGERVLARRPASIPPPKDAGVALNSLLAFPLPPKSKLFRLTHYCARRKHKRGGNAEAVPRLRLTTSNNEPTLHPCQR